ncbi:MAG: hypothetical protein O7B99_16300 [Planctomycetota bacterium]|nr:hypothetical protein [Planctomycetota bacterium]
MSEDLDWSEVEEAPKKKRGIPGWVWWGCGSGCLLALAILIIAGIFIGGFIKKTMDPEYAKERIQRLIPFDEWPEGDRPVGGGAMGQETYVIRTNRVDGYRFQVMRVPGMSELDDLFDPDSLANRGVLGFGRIDDPEAGTIELQGRDTRCMWYRAYEQGPALRVDLTGDGTHPVVVDAIVRSSEEREKIDPDVIRSFLEPFDVWRGK